MVEGSIPTPTTHSLGVSCANPTLEGGSLLNREAMKGKVSVGHFNSLPIDDGFRFLPFKDWSVDQKKRKKELLHETTTGGMEQDANLVILQKPSDRQ